MEHVSVKSWRAILETAVRKNCKKVNFKQKSIWYTFVIKLPFHSEQNAKSRGKKILICSLNS